MKVCIFLIIVAGWVGAGKINAQVNEPVVPSDHPCATMEQDYLNRLRYPQRGTLEEFENFLQKRINELKSKSLSGRTQATLINIPIIVHVVHNGEAVGVGTNL